MVGNHKEMIVVSHHGKSYPWSWPGAEGNIDQLLNLVADGSHDAWDACAEEFPTLSCTWWLSDVQGSDVKTARQCRCMSRLSSPLRFLQN